MIITEINTGAPVWVALQLKYEDGYFIATDNNGSRAFNAKAYGVREGTPDEEKALLELQVLQQRKIVSYASTLGKLEKEMEQGLEQLHALQETLRGIKDKIKNEFEIWPNLRKETK